MPEILTVSPSSYGGLSLFLSGFPGLVKEQDYWLSRFRFWWDDNPAYSGGFDRGWFVRDGDRIAGFLGSVPSRFQLSGEEATVFNSTTWMVLPEYRNFSMALYGKLLALSGRALLFNTTPTPTVARILEALKFRPIDRGIGNVKSYYVVVDFRRFLRSKFSRFPFGPALAETAVPVLRAFQVARMKRLEAALSMNVRKVQRADQQFDDLWEKTRRAYPNTNVRKAAVINWCCFGNKYLAKDLFGYFDGGRLSGYLICWAKEYSGIKALECLDLWADPSEAPDRVVRALVGAVTEHARENSVDIVRFSGFSSRMSAVFGEMGMLKSVSCSGPGYMTGPADTVNGISDGNSFFCGLQGDYGL